MKTRSRIKLAHPHIAQGVYASLSGILHDGQVVEGRFVELFENNVARFLEVERVSPHVIMTPTCTSALTMALNYAVHIHLNDSRPAHVIVPSFTFGATLTAILNAGLIPRIVDVLEEDGTLDPDRIDEAIDEETAAVLAVDVYGMPCRLDDIMEVVAARCPVIVDSAQSFGAVYQGRYVGAPGGTTPLAHCFSLSPSKPLTAIEGGLVVTHDPGLLASVRSQKNYGFNQFTRSDLLVQGISGRCSEVHACVGYNNLLDISRTFHKRTWSRMAYEQELEGSKHIQLMPHRRDEDDSFSSGCYIVVRLDLDIDDMNSVQQSMEGHGIETKRYFYPALHNLSLTYDYAACNEVVFGSMDVSQKLSQTCLALPNHNNLTKEDIHTVCEKLKCIVSMSNILSDDA